MKDWLTLKEASNITGKSTGAIRGAIKRGQIDRAKKESGKTGKHWIIHREEVENLGDHDRVKRTGDQKARSEPDQTITLPIEYFKQQQQEHDQIIQGMLMYRWKFEEADRKLKLLPSPAEFVAHDLQEKTTRIEEKDRELIQVKAEKTTLSDTLHEAQERLQRTEEDREDISIKLTEKTANMGKLEEEKKILDDRLDKLEKAKLELNAKLETEQGKPWWKKLLKLK